MARIMIWPDLYKEHGHWLPCINMANSLIHATQPYQVDFMGIPDCKSIVDPYLVGTSPAFYPILGQVYPPGYSIENKLEPLGDRWKPHHLLPMCRKEGGIDALFAGGAVGLLISGYFNALETLILHHMYSVPIMTMTTYLRHPSDTPASFAKTKLVFMNKSLSQKIINLATGEDMSIADFVAPLDDATELIPCPQSFDFTDEDWVHGDTVEYVEPMIVRKKFNGDDPDVIFDPGTTKVIFGTAGSQVQDYQSRAREFFTNLISMMQTPGMEAYILVLAVGDTLLPVLNVQYGVGTAQSTLPSNVKLYAWVSQLDVLESASAIFMHGGLATIKEAIWEAVPIIIVPHGKDQLDNSLRIQRNGLGVVAQMQDISPANLRKLFTAATTSTWIQQNLTKMQALFTSAESSIRSVQLIRDVLPP